MRAKLIKAVTTAGVAVAKPAVMSKANPRPQASIGTRKSLNDLLKKLRNIIHLLSGERGRLLLWFVEAQEDFFQRWLAGHNVSCVVLTRDVNDLCQFTLYVQL